MANSSLVVHAGGRLATLDELRECKTPPPEGRWHPVSHVKVLETVKETLHGAGYGIKSEKYALARSDARFFGVLDLSTPLAEGVALSVGVRNSVDKSFPLGFAAGSQVFVCDNLAFRSELLVRRKHTINGMRAFGTAIGGAVASLTSFKEAEEIRYQWGPHGMVPIAELPEFPAELLTETKSEVGCRPAGPCQLPADADRYAAAALRYELENVSTAREGTRNGTLNRAAFCLGSLVGAGMLPREAVEAALVEAALSVGLGEKEIAATIRSGMEAGMKHPRNR